MAVNANITCVDEKQITLAPSWKYQENGEHQYFRLCHWQKDIAVLVTFLGYQEWVNQQLNLLLGEICLDGVDAIEVAGCTDSEGIVEVRDEGEAEFFSIYIHRPNEGVECQCDFNNKAQAIEFARALATRTGIPVYGNLCSID